MQGRAGLAGNRVWLLSVRRSEKAWKAAATCLARSPWPVAVLVVAQDRCRSGHGDAPSPISRERAVFSATSTADGEQVIGTQRYFGAGA